MREYVSDIEIKATPERVWHEITDFGSFPDWNPFIVSAAGNIVVGEKLRNRLEPPGGKPMSFKPTVTVVEPTTTFEWLGRPVVPGIFDGRHRFELHATPAGGTRLVHTEQFSGLLVRFMRKSLDSQTRAGFEAMNTALKTRAEATVGSGS